MTTTTAGLRLNPAAIAEEIDRLTVELLSELIAWRESLAWYATRTDAYRANYPDWSSTQHCANISAVAAAITALRERGAR